MKTSHKNKAPSRNGSGRNLSNYNPIIGTCEAKVKITLRASLS